MTMTTAGKNTVLDSGVPTMYMQLHSADPGAAGTANIATTSTRKSCAFDAATAESKVSSAIVEWTSTDAGGETFSHITAWTAVTAGTFLGVDALALPIVTTNGQRVFFAAGAITVVA